MTVAISRDSFSELKNYLGVYLQQGRVLLDADWNENQDIAVSFLKRLTRESVGDGSPNLGFAIDRIFPPTPHLLLRDIKLTGDINKDLGLIAGACFADLFTLALSIIFGPLLFFLTFPGDLLEDFESSTGWGSSSPQGLLRIGKDGPYQGMGFLRLSGHPGTVTLTKTLANLRDLSAYDVATFRYRLNEQSAGTIKFFLEDDLGMRTVWAFHNAGQAADLWVAGFAAPLDVRFKIVTDSPLPDTYEEKDDGSPYDTDVDIVSFGGSTPITWSVDAGTLPGGLSLSTSTIADETGKARISGTATVTGSFNFTIKAKDSTNLEVTKAYALEVQQTAPVTDELPLPTGGEIMASLVKFELPNGTPADLTQIRKYGFELYQDPNAPLVWDLDDLCVAGKNLQETIGANNFIIRGSEFSSFFAMLSLMGLMGGDSNGNGNGEGSDTDASLLAILNMAFELSHPDIENAGRMYVNGLPCVLVEDTLYSDQADPDELLTTPPPNTIRKDTVYLDVWEEPVTYVEDPEIREIALGGPDTTTRRRVRHRVRVKEGGELPVDNGIGRGTLATGGTYTGQANRLYRVEISKGGDIGPAGAAGTAKLRWSEDNASTIQRVIASVPVGATTLTVEDGSPFAANDRIVISTDARSPRSEQLQIGSVFGNVITLAQNTPTTLAYPIADRPRIQRWNAFDVAVAVDPTDSTISDAIPLNDGVTIRFGGRAMRAGDYWTFKTRFLAGDAATGISPETRIEQLSFVRAYGVRHHYAPLAILTRDGDDPHPTHIVDIRDKRQRAGNSASISKGLGDLASFTGKGITHHLGGAVLPPASKGSKFITWFSADLYLTGTVPADSSLSITASFYNDLMTDPATDDETGKIQDKTLTVALERKPTGVEVPVHLAFLGSDLDSLVLPVSQIATSVQLFAEVSEDGFSVELSNMRMDVLEMKKSI